MEEWTLPKRWCRKSPKHLNWALQNQLYQIFIPKLFKQTELRALSHVDFWSRLNTSPPPKCSYTKRRPGLRWCDETAAVEESVELIHWGHDPFFAKPIKITKFGCRNLLKTRTSSCRNSDKETEIWKQNDEKKNANWNGVADLTEGTWENATMSCANHVRWNKNASKPASSGSFST